jgi:hypothetical protein
MTTTLRDGLRDIADVAPRLAVPAGLYDRARRTRRRRQALALSAALAVLAVTTLGLYGSPQRRSAPPASPSEAGLPSRVAAPPAYTLDVATHPDGPATVVYDGGEQTHREPLTGNDDYPLVVIGTSDRYRLYHREEWDDPIPDAPMFLLSPNGHYVLQADSLAAGPNWASFVLDTTTGKTTVRRTGVPLAWSPDSRFAVFADFAMTDGTATAELQVVAMPSGTVMWQSPVSPRLGYTGFLTAAVSPDGTALAVLDGPELHVYRKADAQWHSVLDTTHTDLTTQELAGPAAWTPDGQDVVAFDAGHGTLTRLDATTGHTAGGTPLPALGRQPDQAVSDRIIGWRGGTPIVTEGNRIVLLSNPVRTLITAPPGTIDLQVATDRLALPFRDPGSPDGGSVIQRYSPVVRVWVLVALALLAVVLVGRRVRGWIRERPGPYYDWSEPY